MATHSTETESCNSKRKKKCRKTISTYRQTDPNIERFLNVVSFGNAFIVLACERIKYKSRYGYSHCLANRSNCVDAMKFINLFGLLRFSRRLFGIGFLIYLVCSINGRFLWFVHQQEFFQLFYSQMLF